jgi:hypothetical protein
MIYIGFKITVGEALRLLKLNEDFVNSFYHTEPIQKYIQEKKSRLTFSYIDKGACLFAVPIHIVEEHPSIESTIIQMIFAKRTFLTEMKHLDIDISKVNLTDIDEDEKEVQNPEPYVISI